METSAKTGVNVELAFTAVAKYVTVFTRQPFTAHNYLKKRKSEGSASAQEVTQLMCGVGANSFLESAAVSTVPF